ncbi:unnamed protein product, partial [Closterium sp. NIES-53]
PSILRRGVPCQSFAHVGHNFYCGWSALTTLRQHALVDWQKGRPSLYSLTPAGVAAAQMCMERAGLQADPLVQPSDAPPSSTALPPSTTALPSAPPPAAMPPLNPPAHQTAEEQEDRPNIWRQEAGVTRGGRGGRGRKRQARSAADGGTTVAAVAARAAVAVAEAAVSVPAARKRRAQAPIAAAPVGEAAAVGEGEAVLGSEASAFLTSLRAVNAPPLSHSQSAHLSPLPTYLPSPPLLLPSSSPTCLSLVETVDIRLPPLAKGQRFCDAYRVVLLIDSREKGAAQLTEFLTRVEKLPAQIAALPVGDALWVAQPLTPPTSSATPPSTSSSSSCPPSSIPPSSSSAVPPSALPAASASPALPGSLFCLEWVAERKRVDDLWQSIKSKRFKDQKLRIKHCGLRRPIYVVEGNLDASNGAESLRTASVQTLVHDGFDVHHTTCIAHTRRHYAHLTRAIADICNRLSTADSCNDRSTTLRCSPSTLHATTPSLLHRDCCVTFDQFLDECRSSQALSVGDVFGHMLLQVRGLTVDMATAILRRYPSLPALHAAYTFL